MGALSAMRILLFIAAAAWLLMESDASCIGGLCNEEPVPTCTRLPLFVKPTDYIVELKFPSIESDTYEGKVYITVEFPLLRQKKRSLADLSAKPEFSECVRGFSSQEELCESNHILMHAGANLEIKRLSILRAPRCILLSPKMRERKISKFARDSATGQLAFKLSHGFRPSEQDVIVVEFTGRMRKDKRGIYVSSYNDGQNVYKHIVSQFQPTDARTAFPCFDEPRFRAPFKLIVTHDSELTAYGNTELAETKSAEGGLKSTHFATTRDMPVHMFAFVIGKFDKLESTINGVKVRVLTAPGKRESGHFALQVATDSLAYFEKYIDFRFPLEKLDVVAISDHDKDNTESWGLVFVRDTLLWIDEETKDDTKITTAVNVAHVVVHQWFGNLISAAWWSDLWITEGVAAQFAFRIVQELYPFQSEYFVRIATLSGVMQSDQPGKLHALSPPSEELQTTEQIYGIFDNLEFMKSGSMAEMMSSLYSGSGYQEILRRLIRSRAYKTVTKDDYLAAITGDRSRVDFPNSVGLVETFTKLKGVPLINVILTGYRLMLFDVETFATAKKSVDDDYRRSEQSIRLIPDFLYGDGATGAQESFKRTLLAERDQMHTKCVHRPNWFNEQRSQTAYFKLSPNPTFATYFRARYTSELRDRLKLAVQNKWISPMDRLQLLDDSNQLALAGFMQAKTFGKFVEAYAQEDDNAVLIEMLIVSKTLAGLKQTEALASIQPALMRVFETYGFEATGEESFLLQRLRSVALKAFITQGNQQVIEAAVKAFEDANGEVALFLREPVYAAIAVSGSSQIDSLLAKLATSKSYEEQIRLIGALSLSKSRRVLLKTSDLISSSGLKAETVKPYMDAISVSLRQ